MNTPTGGDQTSTNNTKWVNEWQDKHGHAGERAQKRANNERRANARVNEQEHSTNDCDWCDQVLRTNGWKGREWAYVCMCNPRGGGSDDDCGGGSGIGSSSGQGASMGWGPANEETRSDEHEGQPVQPSGDKRARTNWNQQKNGEDSMNEWRRAQTKAGEYEWGLPKRTARQA